MFKKDVQHDFTLHEINNQLQTGFKIVLFSSYFILVENMFTRVR